ncbi:MAG: hypothetical protein E7001_05105 [Coriobacteriaceae bacterium]|nr:hypothetical protein [Coriobacteriaceae bacterium]
MAHFKRSHIAIPSATLAIVLGLSGAPLAAYGATSTELQQQLDSASEKLNALYMAAEHANDDLVTVRNKLDQTKQDIADTTAQIDVTKQKLAELQDDLQTVVSDQYKGSGLNLLTLVLSSSDFNSFLSNMKSATKVAEYQEGVISESKDLRATLEQQQASLKEDEQKQEALVADQQAKANAASAAAAEAQSYYDSLSDELKQQIAAEQEAARQKAIAEAEAQAAQAAAAQGASAPAQTQASSNAGAPAGAAPSAPAASTGNGGSHGGAASSSTSSSSGSSSTSGSSSGSPSSSASSMVARAQSIIGSGYSYSGYRWTGSTSSSYFTCSGVIDYALGLRTNSNSPESLYSKVNITKDMSKLKYGDLVFFSYGPRAVGHVGIYIGNGMMIDSIPGAGVGYRSVSYIGNFMGGGSIV